MNTGSKIALAGAAIAALAVITRHASGIGKVLENDFYGATITTKDGKHAVSFSANGGYGIRVDALMYYPENMNYGSDWDYWFHIGDYTTLAGAKRGAKRAMKKMGYKLSDKDLNKI